MRAAGTARRTLVSTRLTASVTSTIDRPSTSSILAATSSSSGPRCWVRMCSRRVTLGSISMAAVMRCTSWSEADSPISRLFISMARIVAMTSSRMPMHSVPMPSHTASPVTSEVVTAARARTRPTSAPEVFEKHDRQLGLLRAADEPPPADRRGS